jgi:hypothetical protein
MDTYGWIKTDRASTKGAEANAIRAFWRGMITGAAIMAAGVQVVSLAL